MLELLQSWDNNQQGQTVHKANKTDKRSDKKTNSKKKNTKRLEGRTRKGKRINL